MLHENIDIVVSMYGHYKRYNILLRKPCKITVSGYEGGMVFPKYFIDYNMLYKNNILKNDDDYNFIYLDDIFPVLKKKDFKLSHKRPIFDSKKIKIGLITTDLKLSKDLIDFIIKLLKNKNILLTIYSFVKKEYFQKIIGIFDKNRLLITTYNNDNNYDLKKNLFYIDTFIYNNNATAKEILSAYRPIISFFNKEYLFGMYSKTLIDQLNMSKELCRDNVKDYYDLVMKYVNSEKEYYEMYDKFIKNLEKSKILDNKKYSKNFYKILDDIKINKYKIVNNIKINKNNLYDLSIIKKNISKNIKNNFIKKRTIYGIYFICCSNNYIEILNEQLNLLVSSKLYEISDKIICFITNIKNECIDILKNFSKIIIISSNDNLYEKFAINNYKKYLNKDKYYLYYFHTKGITRKEECFSDWRKLCNYFTINKWRISIELLKYYDCIGINLKYFPMKHFSGNFWWSKSEYLNKLEDYINDFYLSSEMYIINHKKPKFFCIHNSYKKHFEELYDISLYDNSDEYIINNFNINNLIPEFNIDSKVLINLCDTNKKIENLVIIQDFKYLKNLIIKNKNCLYYIYNNFRYKKIVNYLNKIDNNGFIIVITLQNNYYNETKLNEYCSNLNCKLLFFLKYNHKIYFIIQKYEKNKLCCLYEYYEKNL